VTPPDALVRSRYVSLTTHRKDGTGVATPVWQVMDGRDMFIWTASDAWKVKRIRNNSQVTVTVCDLRGRVAEGAPSLPGTARLLDPADTAAARALLARKYLLVRLGDFFTRTLRIKRKLTVVAVSL
jgi:PPOX class probable F420-dependent enzyme